MKCSKIQDNLLDLILGLLPEETAQEMHAHIKECKNCSREFKSFSAVHNAVETIPEVEPSVALEERLIEGYWDEQEKSYSHRLRVIAAHNSFMHYFIGWLSIQVRRPAVAVITAALIIGAVCFFGWEPPARYRTDIDIQNTEKLPRDSGVLEILKRRTPLRRQTKLDLDRILEEMAEVEMTDVPEQPWLKWDVTVESEIKEISPLQEESELVRVPFDHEGRPIPKPGKRGTKTAEEKVICSTIPFSPGEVYASYEGISAKDVIQDGLQWLTYTQNSDGSWGGEDAKVFTTSLAGMCFLADPDMLKTFGYRENIDKACSFIINQATSLGYLGGGDKYSARSHITALNFLVEYAACTGRTDLRDKIIRGFNYTYSIGNLKGWEHTDNTFSPDKSVVGWYIALLASAHKAGYTLPHRFLDRGASWVTQATYGGMDRYYPTREYNSNNITKAAVAFAGRYILNVKLYKKDIPEIADHLVEYMGREIDRGSSEINPYFLYFASMGLFHDHGKEWYLFNLGIKNYLSDTAEHIVFPDNEHGVYWPSSYKLYSRYGDIFYTAMHILTLQTYYRYAEFPK